MFDLDLMRKTLEDLNDSLDRNKELLGEAFIFLDRLEKEDYRDEEEKENFELDLITIVKEIKIDIDSYEE